MRTFILGLGAVWFMSLGSGVVPILAQEMKLCPVPASGSVPSASEDQGPPYFFQGYLIKRVDPEYPKDAARQSIGGLVVVRAAIGPDGTLRVVSVVSGNPLLVGAAVRALSQWRYEPYRMNGASASVSTTITVNFANGAAIVSDLPPETSLPSQPSMNAAGVNSAPKLPPPPEGTMRISSTAMAALLETRVEPCYPRDSVALQVRAAVVVLATVGKDGTVVDTQYVAGPHRFVEEALDAVKQWRYKPYLVDGEPAVVQTAITLAFAPPHLSR